jgi:hypothetical protein
MYRDEWSIWLTARFSHTFDEMWHYQAHMGRPLGWMLCNWLVGKLFYPVGLKILYVLVSTSTIYLVAQFAPFTRLQKVLFAFGYFPLYEYGTILRDYCADFFAVFLVCAVFTSDRRRPILFGLALAMVFQTVGYAILIGLMLGVAYLFDVWWNRATEKNRPPLRPFVIGIAIAMVSLATAYMVMKTTVDPNLLLDEAAPKGTFFDRLWQTAPYLWRGCLPIPFPGQSNGTGGWNTNLLDPWPGIQILLGLTFLISVAVFLSNRPTGLLCYLLGTAAVGYYLCAVPFFNVRHHGHYFTVFIAAMWVAGRERRLLKSQFLEWPPLVVFRDWRSAFLTAVLAIHVIVGLQAAIVEQAIPFSGSRQAAEIIKRNAPADIPVIGDCDYAMTGIAGFLDRPIYIAWRGIYGTEICNLASVDRDQKHGKHPMDPEALAESLQKFLNAEKRDVVLVLNYQPRQLPIPQKNVTLLGVTISEENIKLLGAAGTSIYPDERYLVFLVKYGR